MLASIWTRDKNHIKFNQKPVNLPPKILFAMSDRVHQIIHQLCCENASHATYIVSITNACGTVM